MLELLSPDRLEALARTYGYWAVFWGIALENAGIPLPGETVTLIGGFLAGRGELQYIGIFGSAVAGAILGDHCGYWLGRWGGWPLLQRASKRFRIPSSHLESARDYFARRAGYAVVFGRFIALLRIFAGPLAGATGMSYGSFSACNALGAVLWAGTVVSLSFGFGTASNLDRLIQQFGWGSALVLAIAIAVVIAIPITQKFMQQSRF